MLLPSRSADFPAFRRDRRDSSNCRNSGGNADPGFCVLRRKEATRRSEWGRTGARREWGGDCMYPLLYWLGMAALIVWGAYSAYSAIIG
jgi:hypothetical protein